MLSLLIVIPFFAYTAFVAVERRMRIRWHTRVTSLIGPGSPYRVTTSSISQGGRAPPGIRTAALSSILLGSLVVPGVIYAMATLRFDGIALTLLPELASVALAWCAGWLLLARVPVAMYLLRLTALLSMTNGVLVLILGLLHVAAARLGWSDRASPAYVLEISPGVVDRPTT